MTSKKVMLLLALWLTLAGGCQNTWPREAERLEAPYEQGQVWAVVPMANESGSLEADGLQMADHLARQLETATSLSVISVNRVLAAMEAMELYQLHDPKEAEQLREILGVDGLVVGTITDYDPYDPPKLGIAIELYSSPLPNQPETSLNVRQLVQAPTDELAHPNRDTINPSAPQSVVTAFYNASDPRVRRRIEHYGYNRGGETHADAEWRLYRISMDLYSEFVSYEISSRLLEAETQRLAAAAEASDEEAKEDPA